MERIARSRWIVPFSARSIRGLMRKGIKMRYVHFEAYVCTHNGKKQGHPIQRRKYELTDDLTFFVQDPSYVHNRHTIQYPCTHARVLLTGAEQQHEEQPPPRGKPENRYRSCGQVARAANKQVHQEEK